LARQRNYWKGYGVGESEVSQRIKIDASNYDGSDLSSREDGLSDRQQDGVTVLK
jgi:hypothetical protein